MTSSIFSPPLPNLLAHPAAGANQEEDTTRTVATREEEVHIVEFQLFSN